MSRLTLAERIVIECGIYEKLKLSEIARKIGKSPYESTTDKSILRLMELMGLHTVPADEVNLTPALLKR